MIHKPIQLKNISLSFPHKTCFEDFSVVIQPGSRIAIIGRNGSGKSTLLKILQGACRPSSGDVIIPENLSIGYVPQVIEKFETLSGGQRFNEALTQALKGDPNVLILDEPTNHLDSGNRKSLLRMLKSFPGTLIIVSHDIELLRNCIDTFWHIDNGGVHIFSGNYDDYMREVRNKRISIELEMQNLDKQKKATHDALMKEQERAKKSGARGQKSIENRKWPTVVSNAKALRAEETSGRKKLEIGNKKQGLVEKLSELRLPEIIVPSFSLSSAELGHGTLVSISRGSAGYGDNDLVLGDINLHLNAGERVSIVGDNGSGKTTLVRAILGDPGIIRSGDWYAPNRRDIGYLDQHYGTLEGDKSVLETIADLMPSWPHAEVRRHLNDFLFRKNEEVNAIARDLSGGEKMRLSLAQIAASTPKLLILDEITNNLDLETRQHVIEVLKSYPGTMIVISHDEDFLSAIGVEYFYEI